MLRVWHLQSSNERKTAFEYMQVGRHNSLGITEEPAAELAPWRSGGAQRKTKKYGDILSLCYVAMGFRLPVANAPTPPKPCEKRRRLACGGGARLPRLCLRVSVAML